MTATVKKVTARKDYPQFGIKAGDEHFVWKLFTAGRSTTHRSKVFPKQSQTETSEYLIQYHTLRERAMELAESGCSQEDVDSLIADIEELQSDTESKLSNMPEALQSGETGTLMQERIDELEEWLNELRAIESADLESDDFDELQDDSDRRGQLLGDTL